MWADPDILTDELADEFLDQLGAAATPAGLEPTAAEIEGLCALVAARFPAVAARDTVIVPLTGRTTRRVRRVGAAAAAAVLLSASAAAAATGGVPVPRPLRAAAFAVGLPVDSPAFDDLHGHIDDLVEAVAAGNRAEAEEAVGKVHQALARVPGEERDEALAEVSEALEGAAPFLEDGEGPGDPNGAEEEVPVATPDGPAEPGHDAGDGPAGVDAVSPADERAAATEPDGAPGPGPGAEAAAPAPSPQDGTPVASEEDPSPAPVEPAEHEQDDHAEDEGDHEQGEFPVVEVEVHDG